MSTADKGVAFLVLLVALLITWLVCFVVRGLWRNRRAMATRIAVAPDPRCVVPNMPASQAQSGHRF